MAHVLDAPENVAAQRPQNVAALAAPGMSDALQRAVDVLRDTADHISANFIECDDRCKTMHERLESAADDIERMLRDVNTQEPLVVVEESTLALLRGQAQFHERVCMAKFARELYSKK